MKISAKSFAEYILRGRKEAIVVAIICTLIPFIGWVGAGIVVGLVTLRSSPQDGFLVMLWSALPAVVSAVLGNSLPLVIGVLCGTFLVWLMAYVLRNTASWSAVLRVSLLMGVVAVALVHLVIPDSVGTWEKLLNSLLQPAVAAMPEDASTEQLKAIAHQFAQSATGTAVITVVLNALSMVLIARWWQGRLFNPGGLRQELHFIRLGIPESMIAVACVLGMYGNMTLGLDMMPVVSMLFILAGLSLMHYFIALTKYPLMWLMILYGVLLAVSFFFPQLMMAFVLLAVIDSIVNIRAKWGTALEKN